MKGLPVALAGFLALAPFAPVAAQTCPPPAQACAQGPFGFGGCFMPGAAQCVSGMICEQRESICPPGAGGEGGCYDPQAARCADGAIARIAAPPPASDAQAAVERAPRDGACDRLVGEDRIAVMNALRAPVSSALRTTVEFVVQRARVCGDWAFVIARPQRPGGGAPRWAGTVCAGDTSHLAGGLMQRSGAGWTLVDHALCPSDVAWADWPEKYGAPAALFEE